jgi:chromosome segregation ATPase
MSLTEFSVNEEHNIENDNAMFTYRPLAKYPDNYALYHISSMFVNVQQLKTTLNTEYQHEKHELIRLNDHLRFFIDRVQQLELQNAKYVEKLVDFRRQSSNISVFDGEWYESHTHLQSSLMAVNYEKIDYEFEFEVFRMQSEIYKQLIHSIDQSNDEQLLKIKQEVDQSSSTLINLRTSYGELQTKIGGLRTEHEGIFQQYLKMTTTWSHWRKQTSGLKVSIQSLKNQHVFYKDIRSHAAR